MYFFRSLSYILSMYFTKYFSSMVPKQSLKTCQDRLLRSKGILVSWILFIDFPNSLSRLSLGVKLSSLSLTFSFSKLHLNSLLPLKSGLLETKLEVICLITFTKISNSSPDFKFSSWEIRPETVIFTPPKYSSFAMNSSSFSRLGNHFFRFENE